MPRPQCAIFIMLLPDGSFPDSNSSRLFARVAIGVPSRALRGTLYFPAGRNASSSVHAF